MLQYSFNYLNFAKTKNAMISRFFNILPSDDVACILLYGDIGDFPEGVTDAEIVRELAEYSAVYDKIDIRINSYGGHVSSGIAIFNALKQSTADITIYIDGIAASIASVIAMCGKPVYMSQYARLMIHSITGGSYGDKNELKRTAQIMEQMEDSLADIYSKKTGMDKESIKNTYFDGKDHWFTASEAKRLGFVDDIYDVAEAKPEDVDTPNKVYNLFKNRLEVKPLTTDTDMTLLDHVKNRPAFANCADDAAVLRILGQLENKAGQADSLEKENETLKTELQSYKDKETKERTQSIQNLLDAAEKDERIKKADRPMYQSLLENDYENACKVIEGLPKKDMIVDHINKDDKSDGAWDAEMKKIKENFENRKR